MLSIERLTRAVQEDAAIRRVRKLQPVGGRGDKLFPPTYPGDAKSDPPRHVFETRRIALRNDDTNENVLCVLIDSVQSQANRLEEALQAARSDGKFFFPVIAVDFGGTTVADVGKISTLEAPHRIFDAIIRDSELKGKRFRDTEAGMKLVAATTRDASAVFELSPTALLFGAWNSTGEGGGLGAKFPRCLVSEIIGVGVATERASSAEAPPSPSGRRTGSRIDPLGIRSAVRVFKHPNGDWSLEPAEGVKEVKPSEVNHSNIAPSVEQLGVSVDHALHTFVLSMSALRRIRFGRSVEDDPAGRAVLAALGLAAVTAQDLSGYFLRSRCDLVAEEGQADGFEIVHANGSTEACELDFDGSTKLVESAIAEAKQHELPWRGEDLVLQPQSKLVDLVRQSRDKALAGEAAPDEA